MKIAIKFGVWLATTIILLLPLIVAGDYGGVLHWTQYLAALVIFAAGLLVLPAVLVGENTSRPSYLLLPLFIWAVFAWFQTIPLPATLIGWSSPGTVSAYTDWISPFVDNQQLPASFSMSLDPNGSRHAAAMLTTLLVLVWAAGQVLNTRSRIGALLLVVAIGVGLHVAFGFWCLVDPILGDAARSGFGTFVNRNHAALFFNFGLAASLGLLSWRMNALTGQAVDDGSFEVNDLLSLINDRDSLIGVAGSALCLAGLLACGSRGGMAASLVGGLLAFGWMRQRRGWLSLPVVGAVIGISVLLLVVPLQINMKSFQRLKETASQDKSTILRNGRFQHWGDGWTAAKAHLPAGSGLATYSYAYLPHQESSPYVWFHHADNLWLELIVEQGIIGIAIAVFLLLLVWRALRRLAGSGDPIDQGLRTAGWFSLGALLFSQTFDFGLIVPANLFLFAVLCAAIVSRSEAIAPLSTDAPRRPLFLPQRQKAIGIAVATTVLICTAACLPKLKRDAVCETAYRTVDAELNSMRGDDKAMDQRLEALHELLESTSHPAVLKATAQLELERARMAEVVEQDPPTTEDVLAAYQNTRPAIRRLRWTDRDEPATVSNPENNGLPESVKGYQRSLELSTRALVHVPLDIEARASQIYLDFIHRDAQRSRSALQQLAILQTRNPKSLVELATLAADGGDLDIAQQQWKEAISQEPNLTYQAIEFVQDRNEVKLDDVIPDLPDNQRRTAWFLLANAANDPVLKAQAPAFLERALDKVACQDCESRRERARCEELCGDILYSLDRADDSFDHYVTAIEEQPADPNLRVKFIGRLRYAGKNEEALLAAQRARSALPKQPRFQRIIDALAAQDLRDIELQKRKAAEKRK